MKYEFLEIKIVRGQEIAYLLDHDRGMVIKMPVVDYADNRRDEREVEERPMRRRLPVYSEDEAISDRPGRVEIAPERPRVAPKPVIPPALRGVFLPPDTPGAAVETRMV